MNPLLSTEALAEKLEAPALRIYDCSIALVPKDGGGYQSAACEDQYLDQHLPGAAYMDLMETLSDKDNPLPFMMPGEAQLVAAFSHYGIGAEHEVVLYNRGPAWWALRVWWMLRELGFDRAAVLDGGLDKWVTEGRPVASGAETYPPATFQPGERRRIFVDADDVQAALGNADALVINALAAKIHSGEMGNYARPGHITGSVNVPAPELFADDNTLLPMEELRAAFAGVDAMGRTKVINYCGGGISATAPAIALHLLGHENVQIYDGSLAEWARDPARPMSTGPS